MRYLLFHELLILFMELGVLREKLMVFNQKSVDLFFELIGVFIGLCFFNQLLVLFVHSIKLL